MSILNKRLAFFDDVYRPDAKILRFLSVLVLVGVSHVLYRGIFNNYLVEIVRITPFERGVMEVFRELPGLLLILILALFYKYTNSKIFKIGIGLMAGGLAGLLLTSTGPFFMTRFFVVIFMMIFSTGEHILMPIVPSIGMELAKREKSGAALGINASLGQLGQIGGLFFVTALFIFLGQMGFGQTELVGFRIVFGLSVALMLASALVALALKETTQKVERQRFYISKKFKKFYILELFYGGRKQIFATFAPFVLIYFYGANPAIMSMLLAICAGFAIFCGPIVGRFIDWLGYKTVMVADSLLVIVVCLLYGFAHIIFPMEIAFIVICVTFVLDSIVSMGRMGANVYVQRISNGPEEIRATLSTGISMDHIITIPMALLGGWIWSIMGFEVLFSLFALLGLGKCLYTLTIKKSEEITKNSGQ